MTHQTDPELLTTVLQLLTNQGTEGLAEGIRLLVNEAMRQERSQVIQAQPYERFDTRQAHFIGFKPKTMLTRLGPVTFSVPQVRGGIEFFPSAHQGIAAARRAVFPSIPRQHCQFHLQQNTQAYVPRLDQRSDVATSIRAIFNCSDRASAQLRLKETVAAYAQSAPKLAAWMGKNIPEGFSAFTFPTAHQRRLRTSNPIERVNKEQKRRTRVAGIFPNEASPLRLVSALLVETSDQWEIERIHLILQTNAQPSQS